MPTIRADHQPSIPPAASAEVRNTDLDVVIERLVAGAPPLTADQRQKLRALLSSGGGR